MAYLYHLVPKNLEGNILYPLNILKEKMPHIYESHFGKYVGREHITQRTIPRLNCLWNDVLHFSAVPPVEVKKALADAGYDKEFTATYYEIDPKVLSPQDTIVYIYSHGGTTDEPREEDFVPYNPERIGDISVLPQAAKDYYKQTVSSGKKPLFYHLVPHILYKGSLDVSNTPTVLV